jgi:hypothetical protein
VRRLALCGPLLLAACLDNAGPEDHPPQQVRVVAAPAGVHFPTDTLPEPLVVQVTDEGGEPSAGREVAWSASGSGSLIPVSKHTDAEGLARAIWILGHEPGVQAATMTVTGSDLSVSIPVETAGWRVAAVSASHGDHACAIDLAGDTYCWTESSTAPPEQLETTLRFVSLATGASHTCGLTTTSRVFCWGANDAGQLGNGGSANADLPVSPLLPDVPIRSVVAGQASSCAITADGAAYCWGANGLGILGRGFESSYEATPAPVAGLSLRSISISGFAACGVDAGRQVHCWGEADDSGPPVLSPAPVEGFLADTVALSDWAKCALADGVLSCWGSTAGAPSALPPRLRSISAGYKPFFGLGADGYAYYWGAVPNSSYGWGDSPVRVEGNLRFRAVGGTDYTPLGIELETATLYHWESWRFDDVRAPAAPRPVRPPADYGAPPSSASGTKTSRAPGITR